MECYTPFTSWKSEIFLESNQACFLCRKKSLADSVFDIRSFRFLCQYLNVKGDTNLFGTVKGENVTSNGQVFLCSPCAAVVTKLSSLIRHLEVTNMLIDYKLERLYQILDDTNQENDGQNECPSSQFTSVTGRSNNSELNNVEALRESIYHKCNQLFSMLSTNFLLNII